jgi:hypothetical protein
LHRKSQGLLNCVQSIARLHIVVVTLCRSPERPLFTRTGLDTGALLIRPNGPPFGVSNAQAFHSLTASFLAWSIALLCDLVWWASIALTHSIGLSSLLLSALVLMIRVASYERPIDLSGG